MPMHKSSLAFQATVPAISVGPENWRRCTAGDARAQTAGTGGKGPAEKLTGGKAAEGGPLNLFIRNN
jgi:hypothetical protein